MDNLRLTGRFFVDTVVPGPSNPSVEFVYNFFVYDETTNETGESKYDDKRFLQADHASTDAYGEKIFRDSAGNLVPQSGINVRIPRYADFSWQIPDHPLGSQLIGGHPSISSLDQNNLIIPVEDITSLLETSIKVFDPLMVDRIRKKCSILLNVSNYIFGAARWPHTKAPSLNNLTACTKTAGRNDSSSPSNRPLYPKIPDKRKSGTEVTHMFQRLWDSNIDDSSKRVNDLGIEEPAPIFLEGSSLMSEIFYDRRLLDMASNSSFDRVSFGRRKIANYFREEDASHRDLLPAEVGVPSFDISSGEFLDSDIEVETPILKSIALGGISEETPFNKFSLMGYIVERYDSAENFRANTPQKKFYIENRLKQSMLDTTILYGESYYYLVRAIWGRDFFDYDISTDSVISQRQYFASKPTDPVFGKTIDNIPPEEPDGVFYKFNYSEGKGLIMTWQYPIGRKRDTKYFQIFRRTSIHEPFTCIAELDFNDSTTKMARRENVNSDRVIKFSNTTTFYNDHEFDRNSSYIYAIAAIDAHGLTSGYSNQTRVTFDSSTNKIKLKGISRSGAPKQYPNFFVDPDEDETTFTRTFTQDVMTSSQKQRVKIYLDADCEIITDATAGTEEKHLTLMNTEGGLYKMHFINVDRQKSDSLEIRINDFRETT